MGCCTSKEVADQQPNLNEVSYNMQHYGSTAVTIPSSSLGGSELHPFLEESTPGSIVRASSLPCTSSAKPFMPFKYLEKSYSINTPSCRVPRINELFKSICERYDMAVVNREKVDEALGLFKQVIGVDKMASMEESFLVWKDCLTNPRFTVSVNDQLGHTKDIRMRADIIPKEKRKAQKHIRDLLDACQLFLQQKEFLQMQISADLVQLETLSGQLQNLGKCTGLTSSETRQLPKKFENARRQFSEFSNILDMFFSHVYSLMQDIDGSVHILQAVEDTVDPA